MLRCPEIRFKYGQGGGKSLQIIFKKMWNLGASCFSFQRIRCGGGHRFRGGSQKWDLSPSPSTPLKIRAVLGQMVGEINVTSSFILLIRILGSSPRTSLTRPVTSEFDRAFINLKKGISKWKKQNFGHHL